MNFATASRNIPLAYLRTFLVILVVLHHALLAYHPFAPPPAASFDASLLWTAFPIVDAHKWSGASLIVSFNDNFFMALLFLVSGVFAWSSLQYKGAVQFVADRARRLGLPFLVSAAVLAPLAYCATWMAEPVRATSFWHQWFALGAWPAGPAWFLWVLLAFSLLAAMVCRLGGAWGNVLGRVAGRLGRSPAMSFLALLLLSAVAYLPVAGAVGSLRWIHVGPFFVQASRIPVYLLYFVVGLALGAYGRERGLLQTDGKLAKRWWLWVLAALLAFALSVTAVLAIVGSLAHGGPSPALTTFGNFSLVLSCAASSFAFLALFLRFARRARRWANSLDANAYGIYLLHYACVTWLQFALLPAALPGYAKAAIVFGVALLGSWGLSAALRRVPAIAKFV